MKGPKNWLRELKASFNYFIGSAWGNLLNMFRAGRNNRAKSALGGIIVGGLLGSVAFPVGTILGAVVGGLLGSTISYKLSRGGSGKGGGKRFQWKR